MVTTELLTVPLKRGSDIDVTRPLLRWISSTFSTADQPVDVTPSVAELQRMRQGAARLSERGEAGLNSTSNYYDQISLLDSKIPINDLQIPFKWKDAFDKGTIFGGRISLTVPSLSYEKMCVLFNVGAFNSGVAADQNLDTEEGRQKALKKLQAAAGIFSYLKDNGVAAIGQDPTPDMEPGTLQIIADLMLAQAQEMVVLKALEDKMKDGIVAKLCGQLDEMFSNLMRAMQKETVKNLWDGDWLPNVSGKQAIYAGLAQYHQSKVCNTNKAVGEEIGRLEFAKKLLTCGQERSSPVLCNTREWLKRVERALTDAKKDNDFIYNERVVEERNLSPIGRALVAKPSPIVPGVRIGNPNASELFALLVPVVVHQAVAAYEVRRIEIVNKEMARLKEATSMMNELLSSMNLPAGLEDTKGDELPQSLKDKSKAVKDAGGTEEVKRLIDDLPELLKRNTEILDESVRMLREEKNSDDLLRTQFKDKWNRIPSEKLTSTFQHNAQKYKTILENAKNADKVVKEKFEAHNSFIEMLSEGPETLGSVVPGGGASRDLKGSSVVSKLRDQMEDVETIKAERDVIESEVRSTNPDIKTVFLNVYAKQGVISEEAISVESLGRAFGPLRTQLDENIRRQEELLALVQKNHEVFAKETGATSTSARDSVLKQLASAHDAYFELKGNLREGTKFYNDLTQLLVTFQNKVSDFCFARRTEKEELLKDLTSAMSSLSMGANTDITTPAHHSGTISSQESLNKKQEPPPRPPPPTAPNPYAGAPTTAAAPNPYAGAPTTAAGPNPYGGPPTTAPGPYGGVPSASFPYGAVPPTGALPYPMQPSMPMPPYAPMPAAYNPYGGYQGYPQPFGVYPVQQQQHQQQQQQQNQYPQYPGQQPQWR